MIADILLWLLAIVGGLFTVGAVVVGVFAYLDSRFAAAIREIDPKDLP